MTLTMPRSIHSGQVEADHNIDFLGQLFDKNDKKMMFPDFVQNHSRKVPEAREHVFESI